MVDVTNVPSGVKIKISDTYTSSLSATISAGATTVPVLSHTEYDEGDWAVITVDPGTVNQATFVGKVQANPTAFVECVWTEGNIGVGHNSGATVADWDSATHQALVQKRQDKAENLGAADLNTLFGRNISGYLSNGSNHPPTSGNGYGYFINKPHSTSPELYNIQFFYSNSSNKSWTRRMFNGVWSDWESDGWAVLGKMVLTTNDLVIFNVPLSETAANIRVIISARSTVQTQLWFRVNNDSGTNYGFRFNRNGVEGTADNVNNVTLSSTARNGRKYFELSLTKITSAIHILGSGMTMGLSATAPSERVDIAATYFNGNNTNVSSVTLSTGIIGAPFDAGTEVIVLGRD